MSEIKYVAATKLTANQAQFTLMVAKLITFIYAQGYTASFGEAYRSNEQSEINALGNSGRAKLISLLIAEGYVGLATALEDNVGNGIAKSAHTSRLAIDLMLFRHGNYLRQSQDYAFAGKYWEEELGGTWGGHFNDGNHFSVPYKGVR